MLADNPVDMLHFRQRVVRSQPPDDGPGPLVGDGDNIRLPGVPDNVVRMETLISVIIKFVRSHIRSRVDMKPVANAAAQITEGTGVGITEQNIACRLVKAQLIKMVTRRPFPDNIALPVHFYDGVVQQLLVGDLVVMQILMGQNQRFSAVS
ncbi:hypothetical protein D3C75_1095540 [compost metagenome]